MAEVHVFRMQTAIIDTTEGYLHEMGNRLHHMNSGDIMDRTTTVVVPDEALEHNGYYVHPRVPDLQLAALVDEAISEYRMLHADMPVSLPAAWVRGEEDDETWTLRQYGRVLAIVRAGRRDVKAHVFDHEESQLDLGFYNSIKEAMEAVHRELGKED